MILPAQGFAFSDLCVIWTWTKFYKNLYKSNVFGAEDDKDDSKEIVNDRSKEQLKASSQVFYETVLLCKPWEEDLKINCV